MTHPPWAAVKAVLHPALELPRADRAAFVRRACNGEPGLQREVESLLAMHDTDESFDPLQQIVDAGRLHATRADGIDDDQRPAIEAALGAEFDILGVLGRGGMGSVFLAHERALRRTVAIKMLRPEHASTPGGRERFRREARIAAGLSHPGIVALHSFGESHGLCYFVLEHVRGQSLAGRMQAEGQIPLAESRQILCGVADALAYAHRHGVIHRDIKPANILLDDEHGRPRLADFGISKMEGTIDSVTEAGAIIGTPLYMSPEQARGEELDTRSDIYAFGAVAYELLTGRVPFAGDARSVLVRRLTEEAPPILAVAPRVPPDLARIVMRCLARDREDRWRDADSLSVALQAAGSGKGNGVDELPQAVADVPGFASYAIGWLALWLTIASGTAHPQDRYLLTFIATIVPIGLSMHVWRLRGYGIGVRRLLTVALRPPQWWGMWWPSRFRGPGDLWPRLPPIARLSRVALSAFLVLAPAVALLSDTIGAGAHTARNGAAGALFAAALFTNLAALRTVMHRGLSLGDATQFLFASTTTSAFWQEPHVARMLAAPVQLVRDPDPADPSDYARALSELHQHYPVALTDIGDVARLAMRRQIEVVTALDAERTLLQREAGAAEEERLTARLRVLEQAAVPAPEYRELEASLRSQLALLQKLQKRAVLLTERHAAESALLRGLWMQLASLVLHGREGSRDTGGSNVRIRALCARITGSNAESDPGSASSPAQRQT